MSAAKTLNVRLSLMPLITTLFVGLKLTHQIDWSWWFVLMPFWIAVLLEALKEHGRSN